LGDKSTKSSSTPVLVQGVKAIKGVSVGFGHACAVRVDGALFCWGDDADGDLGIGSTYVATAPAQVPLSHVEQVAAGGSHTCALVGGGTVYCWGDNGYGQLGTGSKERTSPVPVKVRGLPAAVAITAGEDQTCALLQRGVLRCWGDNQFGQLGDGNTVSSNLARLVQALGGPSRCPLVGATRVRSWWSEPSSAGATASSGSSVTDARRTQICRVLWHSSERSLRTSWLRAKGR
jgi:alpha-tubulin suppressor-like RCC1 family protein